MDARPIIAQSSWRGTWVLRSLHAANTDANGYFAEQLLITVPAHSGLRIGMVWQSCARPLPFNSENTLNDFDLVVMKPAAGKGQLLGTCGFQPRTIYSQSIPNEYEMLADRCLGSSGSAGTYVVRYKVKVGSPFTLCENETSEPVAIVWDYFPVP